VGTDAGGRTVEVYPPGRQIVAPIMAWMTCGSTAPGVHAGSGRDPFGTVCSWQVPGAGNDWAVPWSGSSATTLLLPATGVADPVVDPELVDAVVGLHPAVTMLAAASMDSRRTTRVDLGARRRLVGAPVVAESADWSWTSSDTGVLPSSREKDTARTTSRSEDH
jgi:hypothetical protein